MSIKSLKLSTFVMCFFVVIQMAFAVFGAVTNYFEYQGMVLVESGDYGSYEEMLDVEGLYEIKIMSEGGLSIAIFIAAISILTWIYMANKSVVNLGARGMAFSPVWSVGWFFVPVYSLWKPYEAMQQLWQASHDSESWQDVKVGDLVEHWWHFLIVFNFTSYISSALRENFLLADKFIYANLCGYADKVLLLVVSVITLLMASKIFHAQSLCYEAKK